MTDKEKELYLSMCEKLPAELLEEIADLGIFVHKAMRSFGKNSNEVNTVICLATVYNFGYRSGQTDAEKGQGYPEGN